MTNTSADITLYTVDDTKTLVRTIIDLTLEPDITSNFDYALKMVIDNINSTLDAVTVSQALDVVTPIEEIVRKAGCFAGTTNAPGQDVQHWYVDLRSARKLKEGDLIVLQTIASGASAMELHGTIVMFFNE